MHHTSNRMQLIVFIHKSKLYHVLILCFYCCLCLLAAACFYWMSQEGITTWNEMMQKLYLTFSLVILPWIWLTAWQHVMMHLKILHSCVCDRGSGTDNEAAVCFVYHISIVLLLILLLTLYVWSSLSWHNCILTCFNTLNHLR